MYEFVTFLMKSPIFLALALAASTLAAHAQSPADTLQDVRPFSTHALDLLMAREPGVEVISSPGAPGTTPTIHVRGIGVLPGIEPVYVVDGMRRRNLDGIAPESIEKIEVLKNAAAMGQWGPEAAAGVVVVTTRRASRQGFHAGYEFAGGFQSLAHVPEKMTFEDWKNAGLYTWMESDKREHPSPETSFLQKHNLFAQYGGNKLSASAGFSVLDNDGPYTGKVDTHRRYAASWSAEYRPLRWLSLETTGRWNQSSISRAPQTWVEDYLISLPDDDIYAYYLNSNHEKLSETVVQGQVDIHPLPGLYVRGNAGYSQGMNHLYKTKWTDYITDEEDPLVSDNVEGRAGYEGKKWFQWGVDAGWSGKWKGHRIRLDGTFRRVKEKQDNQVLEGRANLSDFGLTYGDDARFEEKFLLPNYEKYKTLDLEGKIELMHNYPNTFSPYRVGTPELKWKESILSVGYDWENRYEVNFSYYRCWEEKLFSSEGWRIPAVTLGWTLSEEPILRRLLPESLKRWSVNASWSETDAFVPRLEDVNRWFSLTGYISGRSMAARHRDLTTSLSFQFGGPTLDLSASWYVNDDDFLRYYSSFLTYGYESQRISSEDVTYTLRNQGVELAGSLRQNVGPFRYSLSAFLTFYGNRVRFGENLKNYGPLSWQNSSSLYIKDGERIGGGMVYSVSGDNPIPFTSENRVWKGSVFPKVTGGIQASIGWNRWQMTVSGHGDSGQTIWSEAYDALSRYYLEENPLNLQPLERSYYSSRDFTECEYAVLDASFFRIDQLRLDYTLPLKNVRLNIFASLENWFLFTKYPGTDPEQALAWNVRELNTGSYTYTPRLTGSYIGVETANYPSTRRTVFGVSVNF